MKIMHQQMLAFLAILMTMIVIVGFLFAQFMFHSVYEQTYSNLNNYATTFFSLVVDTEDDSGNKLNVDPSAFKTAKKVMSDQGVEVSIYDNKTHKRVYGNTGPKKISETLWQETFSGDSRVKRTRTGEQLSVYRGWMYGGEKLGVVRVSRQIVGRSAQSTMLLEEMVAAMVIGGTLAMSLAAVISWRWSHVITDMQQATEQMAEGNYELKLKRTGKDELGHLAGDINNLSLALRAQSDEIIEQEERRKQFMANASHEMRTPLTTMSGLLEGLAYDVFPEEEKSRAYALMQKETQRLIRLVEENLDYEKLRANKIVLRKQKIDAYKMISDLSNQLASKAAHEETTIEISGDQQATVFGDQDRLTQVLFNLINNAIQFTQRGQIKVSVARQGNATIFKVADTGQLNKLTMFLSVTIRLIRPVCQLRVNQALVWRLSNRLSHCMMVISRLIPHQKLVRQSLLLYQISRLSINFRQGHVYKILTEI